MQALDETGVGERPEQARDGLLRARGLDLPLHRVGAVGPREERFVTLGVRAQQRREEARLRRVLDARIED